MEAGRRKEEGVREYEAKREDNKEGEREKGRGAN